MNALSNIYGRYSLHRAKPDICLTSPYPCSSQSEPCRGCGDVHASMFRLIAVCAVTFLLVTSCRHRPSSYTEVQRITADSIAASVIDVDSFAPLLTRMQSSGNVLGSISVCRDWGIALRNDSRFEEALLVHAKGLRLAESKNDTIEWAYAMNNIGTVYRRIGALDLAQEYHFHAWKMSEETTDTTYRSLRNRVMALNGLGNIYLTLGNYDRADSAFHMSLEGEYKLNSAEGLAINYANIGSIYEKQGKLKEAWTYYRRSMLYNEEAGSPLGISLCHTYFGSLYEKQGQDAKAKREYMAAYELMKDSKDIWHALNPLIALAGIKNKMGDDAQTLAYLQRAKAQAESIKSTEHLARIYNIYYLHYKHKGDYPAALSAHEKAVMMHDSVADIKKLNKIQNTTMRIERDKQERLIDNTRSQLNAERKVRRFTIIIFILLTIILGGVIGILLNYQRIRSRSHKALRKMTKMRESFFTNITHEFRTPLTMILEISREIQQDSTNGNATRDKAATVYRQGKGLLTLITQLMDISKIKSEMGNPDWIHGNISVHIGMIVDTYRDFAHTKKIELQYVSRESVTMDFVPDYINKVINNLISNALKFTDAFGKVAIVAWQAGNFFRIDVTDTGRGMTKDVVKHVFEPFFQAEGDDSNIGTGVGLALVKQIITAVKGTISVESEPGRGTTFHIQMPIHHNMGRHADLSSPPMTNRHTMAELSPKPTDSPICDDDSRPRMLIAEDNRELAAYIGHHFDTDYAVFYAADGLEAIGKALELVPDIIITDLMMPQMSGLDLCRQVRSSELVNHVPIIVITAKITEQERMKGLEAGADVYLSKPFNSDELRMRVEKLLEGRRLLREKFAGAMTPDGSGRESKESEETTISDRDRKFLSKVEDYVYSCLESQHRIEIPALAQHLCLSYTQFYRKLSALTGLTPVGYVQRLRVQEARQMMEHNPQLTLRHVADVCGFSDYSAFVRAFKGIYGTTPRNSQADSADTDA